MRIEKNEKSYLIFFSQGKNVQKTPVTGVSDDEEILKLIRSTFKGRFKKPESLSWTDGVRVTVKCLDHIKHETTQVFNSRIFNKSVTQARLMVETAIRNS